LARSTAEGSDLLRTDQRLDVVRGELPVPVDGVGLQVQHLEMLIKQLVERGTGPRIAPLVDLVGEPAQCLVRLRSG
jgi:hypothetical protein